MNFDPKVAEVETPYGIMRFYTTSALEAYMIYRDKPREKNQFLDEVKNLNKLLITAKNKTKKKLGRPFGSTNKKETQKPVHIIKKEPFETTQEFKARKQEELAHH